MSGWRMRPRNFIRLFVGAVNSIAAMALLLAFSSVTSAQDSTDRVTGFALFVEEFGFGQGPVFRPDLATRNPDLVNEAFRQYAIDWGIARVGRLFRELDVPLSIVLNAEFPGKYPP